MFQRHMWQHDKTGSYSFKNNLGISSCILMRIRASLWSSQSEQSRLCLVWNLRGNEITMKKGGFYVVRCLNVFVPVSNSLQGDSWRFWAERQRQKLQAEVWPVALSTHRLRVFRIAKGVEMIERQRENKVRRCGKAQNKADTNWFITWWSTVIR